MVTDWLGPSGYDGLLALLDWALPNDTRIVKRQTDKVGSEAPGALLFRSQEASSSNRLLTLVLFKGYSGPPPDSKTAGTGSDFHSES